MAILKVLEAEVEARVVEASELLAKPAGEFAPRMRRILIEFINTASRKVSELEEADTQPRFQEPQKPFTVPPRPPPRKPQETMEITLEQLLPPWGKRVGD